MTHLRAFQRVFFLKLFCPFTRTSDNLADVQRYPQFVRYFVTACAHAIKTRLAKGKNNKYKTAQEMFDAWISYARKKKNADISADAFFFTNNKSFVKIPTEHNTGNNKASAATQASNSDAVACIEVISFYRSVEKMSNFNSEVSTSLTLTNAATPAISLDQRVFKIQFHLQNMANSAIIIGQELIECKKEVPQGDWLNWLENNFHLKVRAAQRFMEISRRFSNTSTSTHLTTSQMVEMLALPAGEEENFIAEKAAEGTPVQNMTVKKLRNEIKLWKNKANEKETEAEKLKKENDELKKDNAFKLEVNRSNAESYFKLRAEKEKEVSDLQKQIEQLKNKPPQVIETTKTIMPPNYLETVQRAEELQEQVDRLLEQNEDLQNQVIDAVSKQPNPQIEFVTPDDYEENKKQLAELQAEKETLKIDTAFIQALNQFFMAANFLHQHQDRAEHNLKNYFDDDPLTPQRVIQITDIANIFNSIIKNLSN